MGAAATLAEQFLSAGEEVRKKELLEHLVTRLSGEVGGVSVVASAAPRLPNTVNLRFEGADADAVMVNAPDVLVSSGSACTSNVPEPSHVLQAMGMSQADAYECLRFSLGRETTRDSIDAAVDELARAVGRVREVMR
jgi:cysteine desulfurase